MRKEAPTLADGLLREVMSNSWRNLDPKGWVRKHLSEARRFVLDDNMSSFMADLAYSSLPQVRSVKRDQAIIDGMRYGARLPHRITWIEFNMKARVDRAHNEYGSSITSDRSPDKGGWLLVQHDKIDTAFMAVECVSHAHFDRNNPFAELEPYPQPNPVAFIWRTDDGPLPWKSDISWLPPDPEIWLTGISSYRSPAVSMVAAPWINPKLKERALNLDGPALLREFASDLRYLWSLLSTINDIPVGYDHVRPSKGYVARGSYRKFMEHTTIRLIVPHKVSYRVLSQRAVRAGRRRRHSVRGHWRNDWRNPFTPSCNHQMEAIGLDTNLQECKICKGRRIWILEHSRGDASLGYTLHDYSVEKKDT